MTTHITRQKSVEIDLLSVDGLAEFKVKAFTDHDPEEKVKKWDDLVKTTLQAASRSTASPVSANEAVRGGIGPHIFRNSNPLNVSRPKANLMTIEDGGIFATFTVIVSAKDRPALEKIRDESVEVVIIQIVRGVYIARYYDCGLSIRTEFIDNAEDVVDRAGSLKKDTPAYDPYCTKLCKVGDLLEGKKLKATLRFYDHPSDSAFIKQKWDPKTIEKVKSAMNDQEESTLSSIEKYVPFTTWLAVRDPSTNEVYPKFCFDWVSQYKIAEVGGQYLHSLVCPPENIPEKIKQLPLFDTFNKKNDGGDPRRHTPAYVHKQDEMPDLPADIVENCQTKVADKYTSWSIFYENHPVQGTNYDEKRFPLVDSDYDKEKKDSCCFVVVAREWEEDD